MGEFRLETEISEETIEKMISMVDKELVEKIFLGSATKRYGIGVVDAKLHDGIVDTYLKKWAQQKGKFFLLMGGKLKTTTTLKEATSEKELLNLISELNKKYPIYAPLVKMFSTNDIMNNRCPEIKDLVESCDGYKVGMKLSKFLSRYFADVRFDIDLSKIIQQQSTVSDVSLSIDPVDYLMMGLNKHSWNSCYEVGGYFGATPYSCMTDPNTLISYVKSDKVYEYTVGKSTFTSYSFKQRAAVMIEDNLQYTILNAQPYGGGASIYAPVDEIIRGLFNSYFGKAVAMVLYGDASGMYTMISKRHHMQDDLYRKVFVQEGEKGHKFPMGQEDIPCLVSGESTPSDRYYYPLAI